jgi:hypothetical protein
MSQTVQAGILDFPRKTLPEVVWLYQDDQPLPRLRPELRSLILSEARRRLASFGADLVGATIYGDAASYQYHEGADIDVALYIDWNTFKGSHEILEEAFKTIEIPWKGFKLHLFVKPPTQKEQIEVSDAVYDVYHDDWILPPFVLPGDFDPDLFFKPMIELAEKKAQAIDIQMGIVAREWAKLKKALEAQKEDARDPIAVGRRIEIQKTVIHDEVQKLVEMFVAIWDGRLKLHDELRTRYVHNKDIDRYERFQFPEIVWKYLDEAGYVEFLKVLTKATKKGVIDSLLKDL